MNELVIVAYYAIVILGIVLYLVKRSKELCVADFVVAEITILFSIAGVFIAYGVPFGYEKLDASLLFQYMFFALMVPVGLILGKSLSRKKARLYHSSVDDRILSLFIAFVAVYALGFFVVIKGNIPLLLLIRGAGTKAVRVARLQVTHNFNSYYNSYIIYSYVGLIFRYVSLYLFSILFVKYLQNKKKYRVIFWLYAAFEVFLQFYATEKAPLIYLVMIIIYDVYMVRAKYHVGICMGGAANAADVKQKKKAKRKAMFYLIGGGAAFIVLYMFFMGIDNVASGLKSFASRAFVSQSSSVYLQKMILDSSYGGCLQGAGIPLTIIDSLFHRNIVNLSKDVYSGIMTTYTALGGAGTAGSIAIFDLYANFGICIACALVFTVAIVVGAVDKRITTSIEASSNKEIPIAFGSMLLILFFQGFLGHFQTFLTFPFIISPQLFVVLVMTWIFRRIKCTGKR